MWRHLDFWQYETVLEAEVPRVQDPQTKETRMDDEKSFGRGQSFRSILTDIEGRRLLEVVPGASTASAQQLIGTLSPEQQQKVEAVAMDRSPAYVSAVEQSLPQADIVHDPYHLAADLNKAVDTVRRQEHKALQREGDDTLTGTKYLWLSDPHNLSEGRLHSCTHLAQLALKTARAWECKELFKGFYEQPDAVQGRAFFMKWYGRSMRSRLDRVKIVARSFLNSLPRLLPWFKHRISNAAAEGFNSVIQALKSAARGFRNPDHYRIRILFHCGKLNLLPS